MHLLRSKKLHYCILAALFAALLVKCLFSMPTNDEFYYSVLAHRLYLGEELFSSMWEVHQTSAVLYLPLYALFCKITGSNTGIILFFRIAYTVVHFLFTLVFYRIIRRISSEPTAFLLSLLTLMCVTYGYYTFSFNSLGFLFSELSVLLLVNIYSSSEHKGLYALASGAAWALSVLAYPLNALLFLSFAAFFFAYIKRLDRSRRTLLCFLLGGILIAAGFLCYVCTSSSISAMFANLPYFTFDTSHGSDFSVLSKLVTYITDIYRVFSFRSFVWLSAFFCALLYRFFGRKSGDCLRLCALILLVISVLLTLTVVYQVSYALLPFAFAFPVLALLRNRKTSKLYWWLWLHGIIRTLIIQLSTDIALVTFATGFFWCTVSSVLLIADMLKNGEFSVYPPIISRFARPAFAVAFSVLLGFLAFQTFYRNLGSADTPQCTEQLTTGAASGLFVSASEANRYNSILSQLRTQLRHGDKLYVANYAPQFCLLEADGHICNSNCLIFAAGDLFPQVYYSINPHLFPTLIFGTSNRFSPESFLEKTDYVPSRVSAADYSIEATEDMSFIRIENSAQ